MSQQQKNRTALYCRLSREDGDGESMSIANQREMLTRYAQEHGFFVHKVYPDDGYSGTSFDRPGFQEMIDDIEAGEIDVVITKDLSRLGREYLKAGYFIEIYFADKNVRYIAVNDGVDTARGDNEFVGIRNIMNEFYARDISKKVRSSRRTLARQGKFTAAFAPYGYRKDPQDKHHLIVDENTAPVVRRIFSMAGSGSNPHQIADILSAEKIRIPRAYLADTYDAYHGTYNKDRPFDWHTGTVAAILRNKVYIGTSVGHKRTSKSFKSKKIIEVPREEWIEVENTHEAIIDRETWEIVQKMVAVKKRATKGGIQQMFVGLVKCADCGHALSYNATKNARGNFICNYAKWSGKKYCTWHYISYNALYRIVLADIRSKIILYHDSRAEFEQMLSKQMSSQSQKQLAALQKEQGKLRARLDELQQITKKLYEDKALSRISGEEYRRLSADFICESGHVETRLTDIAGQLAAEQSQQENAGRFSAVIDRYMDLQELDKQVLNELIDRIVVHDAQKIDGRRTQQVDIFYRFVGNLNP